MAIFEKTIRNQNFDTLLRKLEHAIPDSSWSAELEAGATRSRTGRHWASF